MVNLTFELDLFVDVKVQVPSVFSLTEALPEVTVSVPILAEIIAV